MTTNATETAERMRGRAAYEAWQKAAPTRGLDWPNIPSAAQERWEVVAWAAVNADNEATFEKEYIAFKSQIEKLQSDLDSSRTNTKLIQSLFDWPADRSETDFYLFLHGYVSHVKRLKSEHESRHAYLEQQVALGKQVIEQNTDLAARLAKFDNARPLTIETATAILGEPMLTFQTYSAWRLNDQLILRVYRDCEAELCNAGSARLEYIESVGALHHLLAALGLGDGKGKDGAG